MPPPDSIEYYRARLRHERALAESAIDPAVRAVHRQMATRYSEIVQKPENEEGSSFGGVRLKIVT